MSVKSVTLSLNGQTYTLSYDSSSGRYKKSITAPNQSSWGEEDHKYAMQLKVTDMAGNVTTIDKNNGTFGSKMLLRVLEKTPPVITITAPSQGAYLGSNAVKIEFTVTDTESGVNPDTIKIQVDSGGIVTSGITKTQIVNGYNCSYTATVLDGNHTVKVNASDNDGNEAIEKTASFTVDTVAPELNISNPPDSLITNQQNVIVSGKTDPDCSVQIKLNSIDQGSVTVDGEGNFSKSVSVNEGSNVIIITATDRAGKATTVTREVIYDSKSPVIVSIDISPNPVDAGAQFTVTVEATDE